MTNKEIVKKILNKCIINIEDINKESKVKLYNNIRLLLKTYSSWKM